MRYDLAIIGAGWAGVSAAREAKARGMKACIIERGDLGGTCLNRGCIPTKALIQAAKVYTTAKKASVFGITGSVPQLDMNAVIARKDKIVRQLTAGVSFLLKGVDVVRGQARFLSANELQAGEQRIEASSVLIATGSRPQELSFLPF
ncbi:MAG: FAD-dependent oxidoreductase, partial [Candidatus Omnitrophica bacterium]|nr:FAD-dependent oxidoreductase [Candidatus Omnitrophota bacterium]